MTERQITSADNSIVGVDRTAQTFDLSGNVGGGFGASGAGDWGAYGGNNYVLGTVLGTTDTNAVASYITPSEFYSVFALQGTPSTSTHNLIIGSSSGHEDIRGSFQTTDIIGAGDRNLILAAGNGDTINPGPGENNILFPSKALATPSPVASNYVNDDPSAIWQGLVSAATIPSESKLNSDLKSLLAATGAG